MLALGMGLLGSPALMLLDEPSLGLSPTIVGSTLDRIRWLSSELDIGVIIVEQKVRDVLRVADRAYVLRTGHVSFAGQASQLQDEDMLRKVYM